MQPGQPSAVFLNGTNKISATMKNTKPTTPLPRDDTNRSGSRLLKRILGCGCFAMILGLTLIVAIVWWIIRSVQAVPQEYQAALEMPMTVAAEKGDELERTVVQLHNAIEQTRPWKITITGDQINGWLATDLVEKFSDALPTGIAQPRVVLKPRSARLLFKYQLPGDLTGVATALVDVFVTDQHNQLALEVKEIRSGVVKLPIALWLDSICSHLNRQGIATEWHFRNSNPVVLIRVPDQIEEMGDRGRVVVESVEVVDNAIVIAGRSDDDR